MCGRAFAAFDERDPELPMLDYDCSSVTLSIDLAWPACLNISHKVRCTAFPGRMIWPPAILPDSRPPSLVKPRRAVVANQKAKWGRTCK